MEIYPHGPVTTRTIEVGGLTKSELLQKLRTHSIMLNEYAEKIFSDDKFTTSEKSFDLKTVELTVKDFGFSEGATMPQLFNRARELGLNLCPLELGPHLRLKYLDQQEGNAVNVTTQNHAPSGSVTIASEILSEDDHFPKGFYLRNIDGVLWLRGYVTDDLHVWNLEDRFIFCQSEILSET